MADLDLKLDRCIALMREHLDEAFSKADVSKGVWFMFDIPDTKNTAILILERSALNNELFVLNAGVQRLKENSDVFVHCYFTKQTEPEMRQYLSGEIDNDRSKILSEIKGCSERLDEILDD